MRPSSGVANPPRQFSVSVLPAPLGPKSTVTSASDFRCTLSSNASEPPVGGRRLINRASILIGSSGALCARRTRQVTGGPQQRQRGGRNHDYENTRQPAVAGFHRVKNCDGESLCLAGNIARH